ncbi:MAG TPA: hypothetical protein VF992_03015 [Thermoplasmata archaeon]
MLGAIETVLSGILTRGLSPALLSVLMAAPMKKVARAQLKKIYVLDERGEMAGEYVLDADCPVDFNDFLKVLPNEGIGDRDSLFVGEYVFTAFQSGKFVFVLLSRGHLGPEDFDWTGLLLTAADSHLSQRAARTVAPRAAEARPEADKALGERESRLAGRERLLAELEVKLKAEAANLRGRQEELNRQKARLAAVADYSAGMQDGVTKGVSRALKTLETAETIAAANRAASAKAQSSATDDARLEEERNALQSAKADLETKYRDAIAENERLGKEVQEAIATLGRERGEAAAHAAEEEKTRREIETRVAELSQRFAAMAKERIVASHRPPGEPSDDARKAVNGDAAELARERKFLQRRAIELLDREERVRDREGRVDEREQDLDRRGESLAALEQDLERSKALLAQAGPQPAEVRADADEVRKDIERRVKIIQQKALELLDREAKLRKRAADLEAAESRISEHVPAK